MKNNKLPYEVKQMTEYILRRYWRDKRELEQYKRDLIPSATPAYGSTGGGHSEDSRQTERVALRIMENTYVQQLGRQIEAVTYVYDNLTETDRKMINLIYWENKPAVEVGMMLGYDTATVHRHRAAVLRLLAEELGLAKRFCN